MEKKILMIFLSVNFYRIMRWVREEEERIIRMKDCELKCIVLDMTGE